MILIMTRWHEDDLAGRILASERASDWRIVNLPALAEMSDPWVGVAGGVVMDCHDGQRVPRNSGGNMTIGDGALRLDNANGAKWVDCVPNFCLIRREVFTGQTFLNQYGFGERRVPPCEYRWGIGAEHADFFLQVRDAGWKVCQLDDVKIDHHPFTPSLPGYKQARWNIGEPIAAFMNHWGIQRVVVNGKVVHSLPEVPAGDFWCSGFSLTIRPAAGATSTAHLRHLRKQRRRQRRLPTRTIHPKWLTWNHYRK